MSSSDFTTNSIFAKWTSTNMNLLLDIWKKEIKRPTLIFKAIIIWRWIPKIAMTFYFNFENVCFITFAISNSDRVRLTHPAKNDPQPTSYISYFKTHIILAFFFLLIHATVVHSHYILLLKCCNSTQQSAIIICNLLPYDRFLLFNSFLLDFSAVYLNWGSFFFIFQVFSIVISNYLLFTFFFYYSLTPVYSYYVF